MAPVIPRRFARCGPGGHELHPRLSRPFGRTRPSPSLTAGWSGHSLQVPQGEGVCLAAGAAPELVH